MKYYATEQRQKLLALLKKYKDRQFSVDEIASKLNADVDISVSSVYRNINKMVKNGDIVRRAADGSRKFVYQYIGDGDCQEHLHMKCEACGKLIHFDVQLSEAVLDTAIAKSNFYINRKKTVLYGSCGECIK